MFLLQIAISISLSAFVFLILIGAFKLGGWTIRNKETILANAVEFTMRILLPIFLFVILTIIIFDLIS